MPVFAPARRPAFPPLGRLRSSPLSGGKKNVMVQLNLTAMIDLFTTIVVFLLASFSANGDIMFIQKDLELPKSENADLLVDRGPVITLFENTVLMESEPIAKLEEIAEEEQGVPGLSDRLKAIRERDERLYGRDPTKPFEGMIILQSDKETDFALVRKVIYSANMAGWAKIKFAVLGTKKSDEAAATH